MDRPKALTAKRARELLRYDEKTGKLFWKVRAAKRIRVGDEAGRVIRDVRSEHLRYIRIGVGGFVYQAHRVVWLIAYGEWPADQIDHVDGDGLNNRLDNLRVVSNTENQRNGIRYRNNSSGVLGVGWNAASRKWLARIRVDGRRICLGHFGSLDDAVAARREAERKYGFHPNHGRSAPPPGGDHESSVSLGAHVDLAS